MNTFGNLRNGARFTWARGTPKLTGPCLKVFVDPNHGSIMFNGHAGPQRHCWVHIESGQIFMSEDKDLEYEVTVL